MSDLAVVIMALDEEDVLARCLESVKYVGELHVSIDAATIDSSEAVARQYTANIYRHIGLPEEHPADDADKATEAHNSYSRMRNAVLEAVEQRSQAKWLMWLDPDEVLEQGAEALPQLLAQMPEGAAGLAVRMNLRDGEGQLGTVMRNTKIIGRGVRFTRRRHEHITATGPQIVADMVQIGHIPSQRPEVREAHDRRKLTYGAFIADWQEFRDGRSAFYCGDYWRVNGHPEEALRWYDTGLALPLEKCPPFQRAIMACHAGKLYLALRERDKAHHWLHEALKADWRYGEAAYYLGVIATNSHDWLAAQHWFHVALLYPDQPISVTQQELGPTLDLPYYGLATVAAENGERAAAYVLLHQAERKLGGQRQQYIELRQKLDDQE